MTSITTAFWNFTINNYTDTHLALLQQAYPDYIRQLVYTLEKGEEGTPHVQAYLRLHRQQRLSFVRKLFPLAHFKPITSDEFHLNAQRYAQKLDSTAQSPATITNNPIPDPITELLGVIEDCYKSFLHDTPYYEVSEADFKCYMLTIEGLRIETKPSLAKFYVSNVYSLAKKRYWRSLLAHVCKSLDTHTHTHDKIFSQEDTITNASSSCPPSPSSYDSSRS